MILQWKMMILILKHDEFCQIIMHDRGDGVKIPKIVDFGMAKGLRDSATGKALVTQKLFSEFGIKSSDSSIENVDPSIESDDFFH